MQINDRIVDVEERARLMAIAHKMGCKVYQRKPESDTWFYYTDGTNIGYVQFPRRECPSLSSVHMPNSTSGTGFKLTDRWEEINERGMRNAMMMVAPHWATSSDAKASKKWRNWDAFHAANAYNAEYQEVRA